jgi:general L-amino acid transport system substrate-binding protein
VEKGTNHGPNLEDYFRARGWPVTLLVIDSAAGAAQAFFAGRCSALTSDDSQLTAVRLTAPGGPAAYRILAQGIAKEPLAPAVWGGDPQWTTVVRWVLFALIQAEESGITRDNVDAARAAGQGLFARLSTDQKGQLTQSLGLAPGWAARAVRAVGNYGEMYERNLGGGSPLAIERGPNRLWNQGGLMYAPPID